MTQGFLLKRPDKKRRTFQIVPYQRVHGQRIYSSPINHTELSTINDSLRAGRITAAEAEAEIKAAILPELKRRSAVKSKALLNSTIADNNLKVFRALWNHQYRRVRLERPKTAHDEFMTALRILEPLSLHTSTVDELQDHWDSKENGTRHKRYGNRINQLLRFLGRGFEISTDRATIPELKWVTFNELERINEFVSNENLRDLYRSLYGTGARLGELFLLSTDDVRSNGTLYIHEQMTPTQDVKAYTKNKKAHDTIILPETLDAVKRWAEVSDKSIYRKRCQHPLIEAAKKAFPHNKEKQISPHKLRHSYVKHMMTLGIPIDRIAQFLGDRVSTVESTYRQWTITDLEIEFIKGLMTDGYNRLKESGE